MFKSKVPLVEFYRHLLPEARSAGYKIVLTALAREADAPAFYDDLKRYWSSLHDATGPDILFVFAGANAADELNERGLAHRRKPVAFCSDQLAFEGGHEKKWKMHWQGSIRPPQDPLGLLNRERSRHMETTGRYSAYLEESDTFARDQTLEIYSLSRFLDLRESELPCLVLTLLQPENTGRFTQVTIPFEHLKNSTLYLYVKRLAEDFQDVFKYVDGIRQEIEATQRELGRIKKPLRRAEAARSSVKSYAERLSSESATAVTNILDLIDSSDHVSETLSKCYREFNRVKKAEHPHNTGIIPELQRLVDLTFADSTHHNSIRANKTQKVSELQVEIRQLEREQTKHWRLLEQQFKKLSSRKTHDADLERWDFFIAYSSDDRSIAERAFSELSTIGRTFLDSRCLRPGERWTERIRTVQGAAKCTVLIITESTPNGWFTESEYLYAIQRVRTGNHVLVPVLYGKQAQLPYGLEQIHAARVNDWSDLSSLPELLEHLVQSDNNHEGQ